MDFYSRWNDDSFSGRYLHVKKCLKNENIFSLLSRFIFIIFKTVSNKFQVWQSEYFFSQFHDVFHDAISEILKDILKEFPIISRLKVNVLFPYRIENVFQ